MQRLISPIVIGHRGYRSQFPENTMVSFSAAIAAGADMIELDVTFSKDRKVVVVHDDTLDRTTSGHGPICRMTLHELRQLDAGRWFDERFSGEPLPTLEETLAFAADTGARINIEIKSSAWEPDAPEDAIERRIVDMAIQKHLLENILVSSFQSGFLENLAALPLHPEYALITGRTKPHDIVDVCTRLKVFSWHPHHETLKQPDVEAMHQAGIRVFPYTVNSPEDMYRLVNMGVDGIITDDPALAVSCLAPYRHSGSIS